MGPWSFVAPRFEKQLACKVRLGLSAALLTVDISAAKSSLWSPSAAVGQQTGAARPCRRHWDPASAAAGSHSHCDFCLVLSKEELKQQRDKHLGTTRLFPAAAH